MVWQLSAEVVGRRKGQLSGLAESVDAAVYFMCHLVSLFGNKYTTDREFVEAAQRQVEQERKRSEALAVDCARAKVELSGASAESAKLFEELERVRSEDRASSKFTGNASSSCSSRQALPSRESGHCKPF